jgi:ADP-ribosylglycohydrolase
LPAAVNHSGDSDSAGAICGNLVGASLGDLAQIPTDSASAISSSQ